MNGLKNNQLGSLENTCQCACVYSLFLQLEEFLSVAVGALNCCTTRKHMALIGWEEVHGYQGLCRKSNEPFGMNNLRTVPIDEGKHLGQATCMIG